MKASITAALLGTSSEEEQGETWKASAVEECRSAIAQLREELLDTQKVKHLKSLIPAKVLAAGQLREAFAAVENAKKSFSKKKSALFLKIVDDECSKAEKDFSKGASSSTQESGRPRDDQDTEKTPPGGTSSDFKPEDDKEKADP